MENGRFYILERIEIEKTHLKRLMNVEDLMGKKGKIHSRLLIDTALAKGMEALALRHEKRKEELGILILGKLPKKKDEQGMSATNEEKREK